MNMIKPDALERFLCAKLSIPVGATNKKCKFYAGWNAGGLQRGRFSYIYNNKIVSYFLHIGQNEVRIFNPNNKTNEYDMKFEYE